MSKLSRGTVYAGVTATETAKSIFGGSLPASTPRLGTGTVVHVVRPISIAALIAIAFLALSCGQAHAQAPQIFFTDLDSGPNSGGEAVSGFAGAYVTLYGNFFGPSQGTSTVTWNGQNCLRVVPAVGSYSGWGAPYLWYQKIVVQLGSGCGAGTGNFIVTVNGKVSNGMPFTVRGGNIFCVSTSGNDSNSGKFPNSCWASIPKAAYGMAPGDISYVKNGVSQTTSGDYDAYLSIGRSGAPGRPIALVVYPGATAGIGIENGATPYAVRTPNIESYHFWTIAGFTVRSNNIGLEISFGASNFRVIGIDASCPNAVGAFQGACMDTAMGAHDIAYLGNYVHDNASVASGSATKGFHNMYFSTDSNHVVAAWNLIDGDTGQNRCNGGRCNACRGIQFHSSPTGEGGPSDPSGHDQFDLHVHDNVIRNTHCDGINFATVDPSKGTVEAYNNVIYHVGTGVLSGDQSSFACIYFAGILNNGPAPGGTAQVYNNTCYDFGAGPRNPNSGAFAIFPSGTMKVNFRNNIVYALPGQAYISPSSQTHSSGFTGGNNLFFGAGAAPSFFASNRTSDPKFVNASSGNFHLLPQSGAIDAGGPVSLVADHDGVTRPQGAAYDIGAYEFLPPGGASDPQRKGRK
jgi:hypothetical protein